MDSIDEIKKLIAKDYQQKVNRWKKQTMRCDTLLVGDSMVAYYKPTLNICLQGIAGDTSKGLFERIDVIIPFNPKRIYIHIGTNDIVLESMTISQTMDYLNQIKHALIHFDVIFITPMPVIESKISIHNKNRTNAHLEALTHHIKNTFKEKCLDVFDVMVSLDSYDQYYKEDGLHLNDFGYMIYERCLQTHMESQS